MTTAYPYDGDSRLVTMVADGVYAPGEDSRLLVEAMDKSGLALGAKVADLCTGSGVAAIHAARQGASRVTAFDICPTAVRCARVNADIAGVAVDVHLGSWARATEFGVFDLIVCNPPYVPDGPGAAPGPARAWDAGTDGRLVLDPLCAAAPDLLADGGSLLLVQSEFADPRKTLAALAANGMDASIVAWEWVPFGPVLQARAPWLEETCQLQPGRRDEEVLVIRADKP
ncbi:HemK2/MTQ2 family protein methyltransferase [Mycobacterium sp. C31M]